MRMKVPLIGTVTGFNPDAAKLDGHGVSGDPNDRINIAVKLGRVDWTLVGIDLETDLAEVEVTPSEWIGVLKVGGNPDNHKDWDSRPATPTEKQGFLDDAQTRVANYTIDPARKLVKSAEVVKKYTDFQNEKAKVI